MVPPPSRPSARMRNIRRELEHRKTKPQAPKRPADKKTSALPPPPSSSRAGAHGKVLKTCSLPFLENPSSSITSMARSRSGSTHPPPPKRPRLQAPPRSSFEVSPLPPLPSRYVISSVGSASSSVVGTAAHLKPVRRAPSRASPALLPLIGFSSEARSMSVAAASTARHLKPLAPKRSAAKKPTAPPSSAPSSSREGARGKVHKPCSPPVCENPSSITSSMVRLGSAGSNSNSPPAKRPRLQAPPRASFQVCPLPPLRSRYVSSSVRPASASILDGPPRPSSAAPAPSAPPPPTGSSSALSTCAAAGIIACHLKPGMRVTVRTRTLAVTIDGKTLVVWLPATVVSATEDSYEVIYEGNLPRDNPFSTVHVPLHHVRPIKPSQPTLPSAQSQPASVAAGSQSASATNSQLVASKNGGTQPTPRPTTAGKSLRLVHDPAPQRKPVPRPTTGGKSISVIRRTLSEKDCQVLDASCSKLASSFMISPFLFD